MRRRAGFTLIELMLAMSLAVVMAGAVGYAFVAGLDLQRAQTQRRAVTDREESTEQRIRTLLMGAKLTADATDATSFFMGTDDTGGSAFGCDRITFTTAAPAAPMASVASTDDFETQQSSRGPVGGAAEVSFSTTAVGDPAGKTGLFERVQRPSDGDSTQGGTESLLDPDIERIGFQFWDGIQWEDTWDTTVGDRRLPAAVKVTIVRNGESDDAGHAFTVPIPASDVDDQNPANSGGSQ
jgi:prepilin-type N-terminal cleavage/methylation domain-containing protein